MNRTIKYFYSKFSDIYFYFVPNTALLRHIYCTADFEKISARKLKKKIIRCFLLLTNKTTKIFVKNPKYLINEKLNELYVFLKMFKLLDHKEENSCNSLRIKTSN